MLLVIFTTTGRQTFEKFKATVVKHPQQQQPQQQQPQQPQPNIPSTNDQTPTQSNTPQSSKTTSVLAQLQAPAMHRKSIELVPQKELLTNVVVLERLGGGNFGGKKAKFSFLVFGLFYFNLL